MVSYMRGIRRVHICMLFFVVMTGFVAVPVMAGCGTSNPYLQNGSSGPLVGYYPPAANFYGEPVSGVAPLAVNFHDTSTNGPTYWSWSFGDGQNSNAQNPVHTYQNPGVYTVSMTAGNGYGGNSITKAAYITVTTEPAPTETPTIEANFNANATSGAAPFAVEFTDTSGQDTIILRSWTFTSGNSSLTESSTGQNIIHTFATPGSYDVELRVTTGTNSSFTTRKTQYITVSAAPGNPEQAVITLLPGWNLISSPLPLAASSDHVAEVFGSVNTGSHSIYIYDAGDGRFVPLTGTNTLEPLQGIWVYSYSEQNITLRYGLSDFVNTSTSLYPGWNLVGYPSIHNGNAYHGFSALGDSWTTILTFDPSEQEYNAAIFNEGANGTTNPLNLSPNCGMWIYMRSAGTMALCE